MVQRIRNLKLSTKIIISDFEFLKFFFGYENFPENFLTKYS